MNLPADVVAQRGLNAPERSYAVTMVSMKDFNEQGLCTSARSYWDTADFCRQLGIEVADLQAMYQRAHG